MEGYYPDHYHIKLKPDLESFRFKGQVTILIQAEKAIESIELNLQELAIWKCSFENDQIRAPCAFSVDPGSETLQVHLPQSITGKCKLAIEFEGLINDDMAGFYRSQYRLEGKPAYIAVTQFEESSARRAFPCFDHPQYKATFDVEMEIDRDMTAISNASIKQETDVNDVKKRVIFNQTPIMSTYLLFFGVGHFEFIEDPGEIRVRVATVPGMSQYAQFGLEFGRKALDFCQNYYGIAYPLPKLDQLAIPDFAFGAMENWGAITFRENLLLYYPGVTSKSGQERISEVIAHEMAHQWFGNLVSPADWIYLWLNESFATYFGFGVVDHYYPDWQTWDQFLYTQTDTALARDGLHETVSIEIPDGEHVVINASTAPIIYSKGASILRQVVGFIGETDFQKGLRGYLKKHEYACAASHHLWEAFEEASDQPITRLMQSWVEQPGYPLIAASRNGPALTLKQQRFTYLPNDFSQEWLVPISIRLFDKSGTESVKTILLEDKESEVNIGDAEAYKLNDGQTGFYRVKYTDPNNLERLGQLIQEMRLAPKDRWGIQNDLFATIKGAQTKFQSYIDFLGYFEAEDAYLPLISISANLYHAFHVLGPKGQQSIKQIGNELFERVLNKIGLEPDPDEPHTTANLRDQILWHAAVYGSQLSRDFAIQQFEALTTGTTIHPDIMKSVLQITAHSNHPQALPWFEERMHATNSEHERMNIITALGAFTDEGLMGQALQFVIDQVPPRNKFIALVSAAQNAEAAPLLWDWYKAHLEDLEQFHPMLYERVIGAFIPACGLHQAESILPFFESYQQQHPSFADVIKISLEKLMINLKMRQFNS
jgi:tricorn protease interacting factor F2/3